MPLVFDVVDEGPGFDLGADRPILHRRTISRERMAVACFSCVGSWTTSSASRRRQRRPADAQARMKELESVLIAFRDSTQCDAAVWSSRDPVVSRADSLARSGVRAMPPDKLPEPGSACADNGERRHDGRGRCSRRKAYVAHSRLPATRINLPQRIIFACWCRSLRRYFAVHRGRARRARARRAVRGDQSSLHDRRDTWPHGHTRRSGRDDSYARSRKQSARGTHRSSSTTPGTQHAPRRRCDRRRRDNQLRQSTNRRSG